MSRRSKLWLLLAWLFTLINLGGVGIAVAEAEAGHAALHVLLTALGVHALVRLRRRAGSPLTLAEQPTNDRLERLQQSLDTIAIEVERIGEAQRFHTKLAQERSRAQQ